jgi:hypothetical protein
VNPGVTEAFARYQIGKNGDTTKGALHSGTTDASFDASKEIQVIINTPTPTPTETPTPTPTPTPGEEICRTPGFWGTHAYANPKKSGSQNITQAVIDQAGGCIEICGETISNTEVDNASSAEEALCVAVKGQSTLQLARQLTAAALNCIVSGGGSDCSGISIAETFQACNDACAAGNTTADVNGSTVNCIEAIDTFNNDPACHDNPLPDPFNPPGPAGSAGKDGRCNQANQNDCTVLQPGEANCAAGNDCADAETCCANGTEQCNGSPACI